MGVLAIVLLNVTNNEEMRLYSDGFQEVWKNYEGKVIARETEPTVIEGDQWPYDVTVVLEFPTETAFKAWYDSPEYQELAKHRLAGAQSKIAVIKLLDRPM